jgi:hypothetical protein
MERGQLKLLVWHNILKLKILFCFVDPSCWIIPLNFGNDNLRLWCWWLFIGWRWGVCWCEDSSLEKGLISGELVFWWRVVRRAWSFVKTTCKVALTWSKLYSCLTRISLTSLQNFAFDLPRVSMVVTKNNQALIPLIQRIYGRRITEENQGIRI